MVRLLVVDDCEAVRNGLCMLLALEPDFEVLGDACDGDAALSLATCLHPDVVLMDVVMPVCDGITATSRIRTACPTTRVLLLTFDDDPRTITSAFDAGADGYLLKDAGADAIVAAIRATGMRVRTDQQPYRPVDAPVADAG